MEEESEGRGVSGLKNPKPLRKGFTTGACAAAGAKAAAQALFSGLRKRKPFKAAITLPSGKIAHIEVSKLIAGKTKAQAIVIKDAGDDPDVTNRARIITTVELLDRKKPLIIIEGGPGVGIVTKPGLKIRPGRPAINPVPLAMIRRSIKEASKEAGKSLAVKVTVSVPNGDKLAKKTMNPRLGIVGGISILGTTGIVEPLSLAAYRHSISCGISVAVSTGLREAVFSTGRSSEKIVEKELSLPPAAFVLTGDHMGFAIKEASAYKGLKRVTVAAQFGKMSKLAAGHFETHCSDSSVEFRFLADICRKHGGNAAIEKVLQANTAREVYFLFKDLGLSCAISAVCKKAKANSKKILGPGKSVRVMLVGYSNDLATVC